MSGAASAGAGGGGGGGGTCVGMRDRSDGGAGTDMGAGNTCGNAMCRTQLYPALTRNGVRARVGDTAGHSWAAHSDAVEAWLKRHNNNNNDNNNKQQ